MSTVAARDLRNHTAEVLRQAEAGVRVTITVHGRAVAELGPVPTRRRASMSRADFARLVANRQADPGLRDDLRRLAGDTTDDLGPVA